MTGIIIAASIVGGVGILIGLFLGISGEKLKVEVNEKEVMTIIYGNDINDEEKSKFLEFISSTFDYEINEIDGNQDIYSVIIALE